MKKHLVSNVMEDSLAGIWCTMALHEAEAVRSRSTAFDDCNEPREWLAESAAELFTQLVCKNKFHTFIFAHKSTNQFAVILARLGYVVHGSAAALQREKNNIWSAIFSWPMFISPSNQSPNLVWLGRSMALKTCRTCCYAEDRSETEEINYSSTALEQIWLVALSLCFCLPKLSVYAIFYIFK